MLSIFNYSNKFNYLKEIKHLRYVAISKLISLLLYQLKFFLKKFFSHFYRLAFFYIFSQLILLLVLNIKIYSEIKIFILIIENIIFIHISLENFITIFRK